MIGTSENVGLRSHGVCSSSKQRSFTGPQIKLALFFMLSDQIYECMDSVFAISFTFWDPIKTHFLFFCLCDSKCQKNSKFWNAIWEILTVNNCAYFLPNWNEVNIAVYISFRICSLLLLFCFNKHFEGGSCHIFLFLPPKKPPRRQRTGRKKRKKRKKSENFFEPTKYFKTWGMFLLPSFWLQWVFLHNAVPKDMSLTETSHSPRSAEPEMMKPYWWYIV